MNALHPSIGRGLRITTLAIGCALLSACPTPFESRHVGQWNAGEQVWRAELSQVKLRAAQSRIFATGDRDRVLEAVIGALQDLGFVLDLVDQQLGLVSGHKHLPIETEERVSDPSYIHHDPDGLMLFAGNWHAWGPFEHRDDLVRVTVTVRPRGAESSLVRASAQFHLRPVEDPAPYQGFFQSLEKALFLDAQQLPQRSAD